MDKKSAKKLDNRNQVKIQKNINDFSWFLLHAENPWRKSAFFQGGLGV